MPHRRLKPTTHGRDHEHGGADPQRIHYENVGAAGAAADIIPYSVSGPLAAATGGLRWYAPTDGTITLVHVSVGTAPAGSGITVQVNRNGTSLGTVTIPVGSHTNTFTPASPAYVAGDYFTVDVTAVGTTTAGSDLVVQLR
jgi:hypothetical protein